MVAENVYIVFKRASGGTDLKNGLGSWMFEQELINFNRRFNNDHGPLHCALSKLSVNKLKTTLTWVKEEYRIN